MNNLKHLAKIRKKAVLRSKALALVRRIARSGQISRQWNINASEDGTYTSVHAPIVELNLLKKAMRLRQKVRRTHLSSDEWGRPQHWGYIRIEIK